MLPEVSQAGTFEQFATLAQTKPAEHNSKVAPNHLPLLQEDWGVEGRGGGGWVVRGRRG